VSNGLASVLDDGGRRREVPCIDGVVRTMLAADETLDLTGEASLVVREVWVNSPEDEPFSGRRTVEGRVRLPTTTRPLQSLVANAELDGSLAATPALERLRAPLRDGVAPAGLSSSTGLVSLQLLGDVRTTKTLDLSRVPASRLEELEVFGDQPITLLRAPALRVLRGSRLASWEGLFDLHALERLHVLGRRDVDVRVFRRFERLAALSLLYTGHEDLAALPALAELELRYGAARFATVDCRALGRSPLVRLAVGVDGFVPDRAQMERLRVPPVDSSRRTPTVVELPDELPTLLHLEVGADSPRVVRRGGSGCWADYPTLQEVAVYHWAEVGGLDVLRRLGVANAGRAEELVLFDGLEHVDLGRLTCDRLVLPNATRVRASWVDAPHRVRLECPNAQSMHLTGLGAIDDLGWLPTAPLVRLEISASSVKDAAALERYPGIRHLGLHADLAPTVLGRVAALPALEALDLSFSHVRSLAPLAAHPTLRALKLNHVHRTGVDLDDLLRTLSPRPPSLELVVQTQGPPRTLRDLLSCATLYGD
jgi:hypothetical protein